jgi:fibronectin-binding autotransporter adhesin
MEGMSMATISWNGATANWSTAADWGGTVPGSSDDALINVAGNYTVTITAAITPVRTLTIGDTGATLAIPGLNGTGVSTGLTTGNLTNSGEIDVLKSSSVSIGGTLTNFGTVKVEPYFSGATQTSLSVAGLRNLGKIIVSGGPGTAPGILTVGSAAPGCLTGTITVGEDFFASNHGPAVLQFASLGVGSIGNGAFLELNGPQAFVADSGNSGSNSALVKLSEIRGELLLKSGASLTTQTNLLNTGRLFLDDPHYGGSSMTVGGTLINYGRDFDGNGVIVGATDSPAPSTLVASGLVNFGTVNLRGSSSSNVGTLQVNGNASSYATLNINTNSKLGVTGSLTQYNGATVVNGQLVAGAVNIAGGQINLATTVTGAVSQSGGMIEGTGSISGNMTETGGIILGGTVADGYNYRFGFYNPGSPGTLTINGNFVENGANVVEMLRQPQVTPLASKIAVSGSVTLMGGALQIDDVGGIDNGIPLAAGQTYTIMTFASLSGTFANVQDGAYIGIGSSVNIGGGLTLNVVYNASSIQLQVAATSHTGVDAFAPTVQNNNEPGGVPNGSYDWSNASNWSGGIPGASTTAVIDDTITNSGSYTVAIYAPTSVGSIIFADAAGGLAIEDPVATVGGVAGPTYATMAVTVAGNLTNAGNMMVDYDGPYFSPGGTSLAIGGTFANGGSLTIGNGSTTSAFNAVASTTLTAASVINTGSMTVLGSKDKQTTLNITGAAGFGTPGAVTGTVNLYGDDGADANVLLEFGSGQITRIERGGSLSLRGPHTYVADAGQTTSNSALRGLSSIGDSYGTGLSMVDGVTVITTTDLVNGGTISVDYAGPYAVIGGSSLTIGGTLSNVGGFNLGAGGMTAAANANMNGLINTGNITLQGANTGHANLTVGGVAKNFGQVNIGSSTLLTAGSNIYEQDAGTTVVTGTLTAGTIDLAGGTLEMASGGSLTGNLVFVGGGATLRLDASSFSNTIGGFALSDHILLPYLAYSASTQAVWQENGGATGGTLSLVQGATTVASLNLSGLYTSADFTLSNSGGVTLITGLQPLPGVDVAPPTPPPPPPPPPPGTTADMILRHGSDGVYEIYDLGNNSMLAGYQLGQVGTDWQVAGLGGFYASDTTDMLLRNSNTGGFEVYDVSNNNITNAAFLGAVGLNWQVTGFGNFSSFGETDMMLRRSSDGGIEVYDIKNNQIIGANFMGTVGLNWQFSGVGNFSSRGTSDMLLRNSDTGGLEVYDINSNQITGAAFIGTIGLDWQFSGVGNFSGVPGETDLLLRNSNTGGLEVYDISHNQLMGAAFIGTVGLDWQYAGVAPIHAAGASDLVLRNVNTGAFEVYDIAGNTLVGAASLGAVGLDWSVGGFAADPPTGSAASMDDSSQVDQLVQAMAGFGGGSGAAESLNPAALTADPSQQQFLTTSQHA